MSLYTIGDLHLSLTTNKPMDVFGKGWENHTQRLKEAFSALSDEDVTVLCGDLSWGISLEEAREDFSLINSLPGKKILLKGNHDYWWSTAAKMNTFFAENGFDTLTLLHNNCLSYGDVALCGTRGWFYDLDGADGHNTKMLAREAGRLETSLKAAGKREKICFLHYPPLYQGYRCPEILHLLKEYGVSRCYYGHLHGASHRRAIEGEVDGTTFSLVSADYLQFVPKKICD